MAHDLQLLCAQVHRHRNTDVVVLVPEPASALVPRRRQRAVLIKMSIPQTSTIMAPVSLTCPSALPHDVLIVEDDPIIALDLEDTILGFGVTTVRTAGNVVQALRMIADRAPDFALLDVGLIRETSFAIAEELASRNVPFIFVTGYGADRVPVAFADRPQLPKPCSTTALKAVLRCPPKEEGTRGTTEIDPAGDVL
jgi:CheY-like chemotaxis protein